MSNFHKIRSLRTQKGVVLLTVLVFLVALTLLALTSMRGSTVGERIARNSVDKVLAMQAAEAALRDAEADIEWKLVTGLSCKTNPGACRGGTNSTERPIIGDPVSYGYQGDNNCTLGQCYSDPKVGFTTPVWQDPNQWVNATTYGTYTAAPPIPTVARQPVYLIEGFQISTKWKLFRITAIGYGADQNTQVTLQSIFAPPFKD